MNVLPFGYRPLGWKADLTAKDYVAHIGAEFDRLSIDPDKDLLKFTSVWWSLWHTESEAPCSIQSYISRAIKEARAETGQVATVSDFGFLVAFRLNQLGHFTMTWDPDETTYARFGIRGNHSSPVGWSRPLNELLYIKDLRYLRLPIDQKVPRGAARSPTTSESLTSDMLCCARKWVEQVIDQVRRIAKVEPHR